ncbi:MAG: hypothetical protein ABFS05_13510 [Bacteroidota bacterium]
MPYIITTSIYPSHKGPEVAERYLEAIAKYPPDENLGTEVVPAAVKSVHGGIKVTGISEAKEGKLEDALNRTVNMMVMFQDIEGFEYTTEIHYKVEEALALIGMSL